MSPPNTLRYLSPEVTMVGNDGTDVMDSFTQQVDNGSTEGGSSETEEDSSFSEPIEDVYASFDAAEMILAEEGEAERGEKDGRLERRTEDWSEAKASAMPDISLPRFAPLPIFALLISAAAEILVDITSERAVPKGSPERAISGLVFPEWWEVKKVGHVYHYTCPTGKPFRSKVRVGEGRSEATTSTIYVSNDPSCSLLHSSFHRSQRLLLTCKRTVQGTSRLCSIRLVAGRPVSGLSPMPRGG